VAAEAGAGEDWVNPFLEERPAGRSVVILAQRMRRHGEDKKEWRVNADAAEQTRRAGSPAGHPAIGGADLLLVGRRHAHTSARRSSASPKRSRWTPILSISDRYKRHICRFGWPR